MSATDTSSSKNEPTLGIGLIGCGGFGRFCLREFGSMHGVRLAAVTDADAAAAARMGKEFGHPVCGDAKEMVARPDVDIVHIATPPFTHPQLSIQCLRAGKHVLCEKPLAIHVQDAEKMIDTARETGRFLAVNLVMRYSPMNQAVARIIASGLLGEPLHAFFENNASDSHLPHGHWFWQPKLSGGIFIEHGVHFFDLFEMWFGGGTVLSAQQSERPESGGLVDQVSCTVCYGETVLAHFYDGFHQAAELESQETRLVFERGSIRLFEWVPTRIEVDAIACEADAESLAAMVPYSTLQRQRSFEDDGRRMHGHHKTFEVDGRYRISGHAGAAKSEVYGRMVRALLADQIASIAAPEHHRLVSEENGLRSLTTAARADQLARWNTPLPPKLPVNAQGTPFPGKSGQRTTAPPAFHTPTTGPG